MLIVSKKNLTKKLQKDAIISVTITNILVQSERHSREDWYRVVRHRNLVPKARLCHWRPFTPEASRRHVLNV